MPKLIILRGPAGAGKSTVARALQQMTDEPTAVIEQDYYQLQIFRNQQKKSHEPRAEMLLANVSIALKHGFNVILEGFLYYPRYRAIVEAMLNMKEHEVYPFYFDISMDETFRRHATREKSKEFDNTEMASWYHLAHPLGVDKELIIDESSTLEQTIGLIRKKTGL